MIKADEFVQYLKDEFNINKIYYTDYCKFIDTLLNEIIELDHELSIPVHYINKSNLPVVNNNALIIMTHKDALEYIPKLITSEVAEVRSILMIDCSYDEGDSVGELTSTLVKPILMDTMVNTGGASIDIDKRFLTEDYPLPRGINNPDESFVMFVHEEI